MSIYPGEIPFMYLLCGVQYESRLHMITVYIGRGSTIDKDTAYGPADSDVFGDGDLYGDLEGRVSISRPTLPAVAFNQYAQYKWYE